MTCRTQIHGNRVNGHAVQLQAVPRRPKDYVDADQRVPESPAPPPRNYPVYWPWVDTAATYMATFGAGVFFGLVLAAIVAGYT